MIAKLIAPLTIEQFLSGVHGEQWHLAPGRLGSFSGLLEWPVLNEFLNSQVLRPPRLRLSREGRALAPESYRRGDSLDVDPGLLQAALRDGATLVIDAIDELHRPIRDLAVDVENALGERAQVNAYASWTTTKGFSLHWDDHDVFVIQLSGAKRWRVCAPTRHHPLFRDRHDDHPGAGEPLWEGELSDGDVLYLPRGFWHAASTSGSPSLHLTVGVCPPTGIDLVRWLADQLCSSELFRRDLPRHASRAEQAQHVAALRAELMLRWDVRVIDRFFVDRRSHATPRAAFSLPWAALPDGLPGADHVVLRSTVAPPPAFHAIDGDRVELCVAGTAMQFAGACRPLLVRLFDGHAACLRGLEHVVEEDLAGVVDVAEVRPLVADLVGAGLLAVEPTPCGCDAARAGQPG